MSEYTFQLHDVSSGEIGIKNYVEDKLYQIKCKVEDGGTLPKKAHDDDACYDLYTPKKFRVLPFGIRIIDTMVSMELPKRSFGLILTRSSILKRGMLTFGVIDCNYRGHIKVIVINPLPRVQKFNPGDRIAQMAVIRLMVTDTVLVDELTDTDRGGNGFGSTGA